MPYAGLDSLPFFSEADIARALTWGPLIDALEVAMIDLSAGNVAQPVRQITPVPGEDGFIASMPAVGQAMAVKIVTLNHSNAGTDLPTHQGVILLFDKSNGSPLAAMDGRLITEMRTAAGSAAAARALAPKQCDVLTIIGTGVQARAHAAALAHVRSFQAVHITGRNAEAGTALAADIGATFVADAETAVQDADIVITATSATDPVLHGAWLRPGAFVFSVGWNGPEGRELDAAAMANTVIVESRAAALDQAGDIRANNAKIFAEIGEIYAGTKSPPKGATIIYDSIGVAIMDAAAAQLAYEGIEEES